MKTAQYLSALLIACGTLVSCGGEKEETLTIETSTSDIISDSATFMAKFIAVEERINNNLEMPSEKDLKEASSKFQEFATMFPDNEESPDYLLKASDISMTTGQAQKSIKILDRIITDFPNYKRMEDVKYNRASHLDFEIRDTTRAKEAYTEFIESYPSSPLVNDCKSRIENIQYSMEELTEKFLKDLEKNGVN